MEEEVDNPPYHISEKKNNDDDTSFDIEGFPTESDESIIDQEETMQRKAIRRWSNRLRITGG